MGVRNFDASRITAKNQHRALYGYYNTVVNNSAIQATSVRSEQPSTQMGGVVTERRLGACSCSTDPNMGYITAPFQNPVNFGSANNNGS